MSFIRWCHTRDIYLMTSKYLVGAAPSLLLQEYPDNRWRIKQLQRDKVASVVAELNHMRCLVCLASDMQTLEGLIKSVRTLVENCSWSLVWCSDVDASTSLECKRYKLLDALRGYVVYFIPTIESFYPPVVEQRMVRRIVAGGSHYAAMATAKQCSGLQKILPGGFSDLSSIVWGKTTDAEFFESLYYNSVGNMKWPDDFMSGWKCNLKVCGPSPQLEVDLLVDGENVLAYEFLLFVKYQLSVKLGVKVSATIYCDDSKAGLWEYLHQFVSFSLNIERVQRLLESKSMLDFAIYTEVSRRYYKDGQRDFVIFSSDSDYSRLLETFPDAVFTFVCKQGSTSRVWREKLEREGIPHYWIDESCSQWNSSVFATNYLVAMAKREHRDVYSCDRDWSEFLKRVNWNESATSSRVAQARLRAQC